MQLLAGIGPFGLPELAINAFIVILVFGVGRLPEVGGAIGKSIREFRKSTKDDDAASPATMESTASTEPPAAATSPGAASDAISCSECGGKNGRDAKFCAHCGHSITAAVS